MDNIEIFFKFLPKLLEMEFSTENIYHNITYGSESWYVDYEPLFICTHQYRNIKLGIFVEMNGSTIIFSRNDNEPKMIINNNDCTSLTTDDMKFQMLLTEPLYKYFSTELLNLLDKNNIDYFELYSANITTKVLEILEKELT